MNKKIVLLTLFLLVALAQLYVPAKMILNREDVLKTGTIYKFKTAPIDPNDPFRGKYIALDFEETLVEVYGDAWEVGDHVYVSLKNDNEGFAKAIGASIDKPSDNSDYLKVRIRRVIKEDPKAISIEYPFDRFYMEETKAPDAEITYQESLSDTSNTTYALVYIKHGEAVLNDVLINDKPIGEIIQAQNKSLEQ